MSRGVKMNLSEFVGASGSDLPTAPGAGGDSYSSGAYRPRGAYGRGDREGEGGEGGRGGYGERRERRERGGEGEDGEREPLPPSRADEADRWRRSDNKPVMERRREEMPGRGDSEDRWRASRPAGGDDRRGGYGDRSFDRRERDFGGDRFGGDRFGGDREERRGGDRFGGDRFGDDRRGGYGDDRRGGFGRDEGRDTRPAHLRNLVKKSPSGDIAGSSPSPSPPASDRFRRPEREEPEGEGQDERRGGFGGEREERRGGFGGDREERRGGYGDREERRGGYGDREERRGGYGDREPREDRFGGGDRSGGRFARFEDREPRGDRFGGRDEQRGGGRGYGGDRFGRGGDYGGDYGALPTGPASRNYEDEAPRSMLKKKAASKEELTAKPQPMAERQVAVDESLLKGVVSLKEKVTPLEAAVEDKQTITDEQLLDSLQRLKLEDSKKEDVLEYGVVLAKSLVEGKVNLASLVLHPSLLSESLVAFKKLRGDKELLALVRDAEKNNSKLDVVEVLSKGLKDKELDAFLEARGLIILKPLPDLSEEVAKDLEQGVAPADLLNKINTAVDNAKLAPGLGVTLAVATHVFGLVFAEPTKPNMAALEPYQALLARVAPSFDSDAQLKTLFTAQAAWFKAGAAKGVLKELFQTLHKSNLIKAEVFDLWRNDVTEKMKNGKAKALLQVHAWITEIQPKVRAPVEEEEYGADEELAEEFGDDY